jgi:hypothetical protein
MESAARAVIGENRSNEAAYAAAGSSFANVLTQGITLTGQIAVRASETQATKQKSLALQAKFREIEAK